MNGRELIQQLDPESDEKAILSAVYFRDDGKVQLRFGSLLIGPPAIADVGWESWRRASGLRTSGTDQAAAVPATFSVDLDSVIAGRAVLSISEAQEWTREVVENATCHPVGSLPSATCELGPARSPVTITTHNDTAAGALATGLRPVRGFHFPLSETPESRLPLAEPWDLNGISVYMPAVSLLALSWFEGMNGEEPSGLLVGRFERRAWLARQKLRPEDELYDVVLGLEPDRIELADLELEVEERVNDELVIAERLRLEDVDNRESHDGALVSVSLPTLGRQVKRAVRLHDREGRLLDAWEPFNIVEKIGMTMSVNGHEQPTTWTGDLRDAPDLVELLGATERVRAQYSALRQGGLAERLFDDRKAARTALRRLVRRAPGGMMVIDPYFSDWELLAETQDPPPRVLVGAKASHPPDDFRGQVARWKEGKDEDVAPFHDRFFLWPGGGVSIGTSMGPGRDRLFRIVRISAVESEELLQRFALWWADGRFERLL